MAVVSSEVAQRPFAFENRGRSNLLRDRPIADHVSTISASRQSHFHRARGKSVHLRPNKRELFQSSMCFCLAAARWFGVRRSRDCGTAFESADMSAHCKVRFRALCFYSRSHFASSRAQYVTTMSAPARLRAVMISRTAARSSKIPFSAAALTMAYSPLT